MATGRDLGAAAEARAADYLVARGIELLERNYRCRYGEIDLVVRDGEQLVFVEVRLRRAAGFGDAFDSVDAHKQRRLSVTARHYLQRRRLDMPCRFDVIGIDADGHIDWLRDAFSLA